MATRPLIAVIVVAGLFAAVAAGAPATLSADSADTVSPGDTVTVTFTVTNTGDEESAYILNISDYPDDWTIADQQNDGGTWNDDEKKWLWLTVEPDANKQPTVTFEVPEGSADGPRTIDAEVRDSDEVRDTVSRTIEVRASDGGDGGDGSDSGSSDGGSSDGGDSGSSDSGSSDDGDSSSSYGDGSDGGDSGSSDGGDGSDGGDSGSSDGSDGSDEGDSSSSYGGSSDGGGTGDNGSADSGSSDDSDGVKNGTDSDPTQGYGGRDDPEAGDLTVEVAETNAPVESGEKLVVTARVTNDGVGVANGTVELLAGGETVDSTDLSVGESGSESVRLDWEDASASVQRIEIRTEDAAASSAVTIARAAENTPADSEGATTPDETAARNSLSLPLIGGVGLLLVLVVGAGVAAVQLREGRQLSTAAGNAVEGAGESVADPGNTPPTGAQTGSSPASADGSTGEWMAAEPERLGSTEQASEDAVESFERALSDTALESVEITEENDVVKLLYQSDEGTIESEMKSIVNEYGHALDDGLDTDRLAVTVVRGDDRGLVTWTVETEWLQAVARGHSSTAELEQKILDTIGSVDM